MKEAPLPHVHPKCKDDLDKRKEAISQAVDDYGYRLFCYARSFVSDHHLAEDAIQRLWLDAFRTFKIKQIKDIGLLKYRLLQILVDEVRKRNIHAEVDLSSLEDSDLPADEWLPEPDDEEEEARLWKHFWRNFDELNFTEEEKQGFWLKERYGYSIKEIAKRLDVPYATVGDRLNKVRDKCMAHLNGKRYE
jgi:RNA polymerase sigma factor (sigma-70 family)